MNYEFNKKQLEEIQAITNTISFDKGNSVSHCPARSSPSGFLKNLRASLRFGQYFSEKPCMTGHGIVE